MYKCKCGAKFGFTGSLYGLHCCPCGTMTTVSYRRDYQGGSVIRIKHWDIYRAVLNKSAVMERIMRRARGEEVGI